MLPKEQSSQRFLLAATQTGRSVVGQPPGSLSLQPCFHKAEAVDERCGYLGSFSVSIWQLSCLQIIFLIRTIGKIHQSGKKKVCIEMNT